MEQKNTKEAINDLEIALKVDTTRQELYLQLSDLYLTTAQSEKSKNILELCIYRYPKNADAKVELAKIYFYVQMYTEAMSQIIDMERYNLQNSDSYFVKYNEKIAPFFITAQVIVPYLVGSLFVFFYFFPKNMFHEKYGWVVLGVMLLIFFLRSRFTDDLLFEEDENRAIRPMRGLVVFTIILLVVSRVVFHHGYTFSW